MNLNISYNNMFQWAFALSPVPSYLPQYFSIMQQLASADGTNDDDDPSAGDSGNNGNPTGSAARMSIDRGGDHLRKRNLQDSQLSSIFASSPNSGGAAGLLAGSPSKSFEQISGSPNGNCSFDEADSNKLDAGMSRATVLLLLSSHLLRLLYFHGLILEEQRPVLPVASAGSDPNELITPTTAAVPHIPTSSLQWELLGQSLSMIIVQLMLLHAMMLLRRKQMKRQRKRLASNGEILGHASADSLLSSGITVSPGSGSFMLPSLAPGSNYGYNHNDSSNDSSSDSPSFWRTKRRLLYRDLKAHFHNLFSPRNILQKHSFLEYLELLFLSSMAVKLVFDYHWYPLYRMRVVEGLKHTSICMESCLALPQMVRNYRNRTTEGLSAVMVGGWVAGDFFKLCYFLFSMIGSGDTEGPNNNMFALGSLLSLSLDSIVGIQMAWWYPEPWALQWQQRIMRSVRHWKTNKDDDAGESLIINNEQVKGGLFTSLLRTLFQWARGIRPPSNAS